MFPHTKISGKSISKVSKGELELVWLPFIGTCRVNGLTVCSVQHGDSIVQ